jgi:hypothetical protein
MLRRPKKHMTGPVPTNYHFLKVNDFGSLLFQLKTCSWHADEVTMPVVIVRMRINN